MSIQFSLTADGIGAIYTSSDVLAGQDLLDADARLRDEVKRGLGTRYLFVDHSAIPEERVDSESIRGLAKGTTMTIELISDGIVAIVAPNDVLFGLSRMWATLAEQEGLAVLVTRTREEAMYWLQEELTQRELKFRLAE